MFRINRKVTNEIAQLVVKTVRGASTRSVSGGAISVCAPTKGESPSVIGRLCKGEFLIQPPYAVKETWEE